MFAEVITIGDELLIGQTVDTNSAWIGEHMALLGIPLVRITSVADSREAIIAALDNSTANVVLITGGLGPTRDDITKSVLCEYFNTTLVRNKEVVDRIEAFFAIRNHKVRDVNYRQADLPETCEVLPNKHGTASGMWFSENNRVFVSMPGVPYEMKGIMLNEVMPRLTKHLNPEPVVHQTVLTTGVGESTLAEMIAPWEDQLRDEGLSLAYLPSPGIVRLRVSAKGGGEAVKAQVQAKIDELYNLVPNLIFGRQNDRLEEVLGNLLKQRNETVATAESCTGGYMSHLITCIPGSSNYYWGSVISYTNAIKQTELGVTESDLRMHGAVSQPVVEQMARGVRARFGTTYGVASSGIAGPDGGSVEKPVGTVWLAVADEETVISQVFSFGEERERNIRKSALAALNMLRLHILQKEGN